MLVTGAARRIGRAVAEALADDGWAVGVHYRHSGAAAREVVAAIEAAGGCGAAVAADLSREDEAESLVTRTADALGTPLVCLVNNASVFEPDTLETVTRESWDRHIAVNLRAPLLLTQAFARALPPDAEGQVVNLLDQQVWNPGTGFLSYTVSKSGLWTLTTTLALALAPRVRVNGVGPGPVLPSPRQTQARFDRRAAATPLGRAVAVADVVAAVRFLLAAPSVTGQMIAVDSGQHLTGPLEPDRK